MAKVLIIYSSKYGSTKKYAEWIAKELNGSILDINNIDKNSLSENDIIILGISLYPEKIKGINFLEKYNELMKNKRLIIFSCGMANFNNPKNVESVNKRLGKVIPKEIFEKIRIFCLRGSIDYKKMNFKDRVLMGLMKKSISKKKTNELNEEDKLLLETYGNKADFMDKNNIKDLIEYCKM